MKKLVTRILIVDDQKRLLKVVKRFLEMNEEFEVDTASCVNEALVKIDESVFDVSLSPVDESVSDVPLSPLDESVLDVSLSPV